MEYNSFYGGRQGASFVIQEKYKSIKAPDVTNEIWNKIIREDLGLAEGANISNEQRESWNKQYCMVSAFQQGNSYKTVNYDEYVIIDTENKNDPDNGRIYRRGYDYNNNMGGALYVGQIVGPAGLAPHTEMKTINEVESIKETEGFEYRRGKGEYAVTNASLIAGKNEDGTFNDAIEWSCCSVRDANSHESTAHIGFKFPYTVIDFTAKSVSAYTSDKAELVSRVDDETHPFYEKWQLQVPKGIKGDALKNLRESTNADGNRILVYDSINYDTKAEGVTTTQTIGLLNDIEKVSITAAGKITIEYSAAANASFQLKYPSTIALDSSSQKLKVTYTDNSTALIGDPINYVLETAIPTEGNYRYHLLIRYNVKKGTVSYNGKSDWFDLGAVKSDNGILIGGNIQDSTLVNIQLCISKLNTTYPDGRDDGKIMTVGSSAENKGFYAYDYGAKTWYYLGTIGSASLSVMALPENADGSAPDVLQDLPTNGLWFVTINKE